MSKRTLILPAVIVCALASALALTSADAQRRAESPAQTAPRDPQAESAQRAAGERLREQVSADAGIIPDRLRLGDLVTRNHTLTGRKVYEAKFTDRETGETYAAAVDADGAKVDAAAVAAQERRAKAARYGKLDPKLAAVMSGDLTEADAAVAAAAGWAAQGTVPVSVWLNVPVQAPRRLAATTSTFAADEAVGNNLASIGRGLSASRQGVVEAIRRMGAEVRASKYAPAVFASLTPGQIKLLARRNDVDTIYYGAENYALHNDKSSTTLGAIPVWQGGNFGNLGLGMVRPVVHEPDGIADFNPYLNNGTHAALLWCTAGVTGCPLGKNNVGPTTDKNHATRVAGVIASTHPLVRGMAPAAQVLLSANSQDFTDVKLVDAFEWARENGGDPTNMSWGSVCGGGLQNFNSRYVDYASRFLGATFVISSGNTSNCSSFPDPAADFYVGSPGLAWSAITVGSFFDGNTASWSNDTMSGFSRYVNPVFASGMEKPEVVAMGEGVRTTDNQGGTHLTPSGINGTSFSAPQVAGQVALMLSRQPGQNQWPETNKAAVLASAFHDIEPGTGRDGVGAVMLNISDDTYRLGRFRNDCGTGCLPLTTANFPRNYSVSLTAGQVVRIAIAWNAHATAAGLGADVLGADIDLHVFRPGGVLVANSVSADNGWELVQFTAPVTGVYTVRASVFSSVAGWPGTYIGMAYSVRSLPDFCTGVGTGPIPTTTTVSTANGPTWFDSYAGWATNQSGREYIRRINVVAGGPNDIVVTDTNPSLDLHIIRIPSCTANPLVPTVLANGANAVSLINAPAGTYYVVADGLNGAVGTTGINIKLNP